MREHSSLTEGLVKGKMEGAGEDRNLRPNDLAPVLLAFNPALSGFSAGMDSSRPRRSVAVVGAAFHELPQLRCVTVAKRSSGVHDGPQPPTGDWRVRVRSSGWRARRGRGRPGRPGR